MVGSERLTELEALSKKVADAISEHGFIRLISHNDADGLSAAGIMCNALNRQQILFHATIVSQFDLSTVEMIEKTSQEAVILCDMGSGQAELASKIRNAIIIDHHKPTGKLEQVHFNPHLVGIDGSSEMCASCGAYMVARQMGDNTDLAGLAIAGAMGDKQPMEGANRFILDEAVQKKVVTVRKGLKAGDGTIEELLEYGTDPYLDITGDREKIRSFVDALDIKGRIKDLTEEQLIRLTSVLVLKLAKQGSISAINSLIGDIYTLNREVVSNIFDLINILNACGKEDKHGLGIAVCMRDASVLDEAQATAREHQRTLINVLKKAEKEVKSKPNIRFLILDDASGTGIVAGTMTRYLYPDKPFITLNEVEDKIKVSARGTRKLVTAGLDLAAAMREASAQVGGSGGGHDIASGATIPRGTAMKFIDLVDSIVEKQLRGKHDEDKREADLQK
ncbi:MAG: DHH family phosphoesterase [Candidatus Methanoperedens sp.]|nr:DHH family phosphoesterase [Candidatus Methanoperedens sp.]MCZ7361684.1 DHH family phosphoesterase [Candidatus Methanoperedens sp.]HLB71894.1 DHH family phosphoesterase [Candidatus Methanoperedens sp.]